MILANVIFPAPAFVYVMSIYAFPLAAAAMIAEVCSIWLSERKTRSFKVCAGHVALANIVSTIAGIALLFLPGIPSGFSADDKSWERSPYWWQIVGFSFVVFFILSILIEGAFYRWNRIPLSPAHPWRSSLIGNTVSYGILAIFWFPTILSHATQKK